MALRISSSIERFAPSKYFSDIRLFVKCAVCSYCSYQTVKTTGRVSRSSLPRRRTFRTLSSFPKLRRSPDVGTGLEKNPPLLKESNHPSSSSVCNTEVQESSILASVRRQISDMPVQWQEAIPMCTLFFFMAFINTVINNVSLTMVMTASGGGAEVIPYLNVYAVLPISLAFTVAYAYAAHHISRDKLFNIVIVSFAASLALFSFVLYPNHQFLHLDNLAATLTQVLPSGLAGGIGMIKNWTFTLYYCISELWGDVGLSLLFWGFANDITHVDHAPFLYPLFGFGANLAQTLGGLVLKMSSSGSFTHAFKSLTVQMLFCSAIVLALHQWIVIREKAKKQETKIQEQWKTFQKMHINNSTYKNPSSNGHPMLLSMRENQSQSKKPKKEQKSFRESIRLMLQCPQIRCLGIMTIAQGLAVTLMEFIWKCHLKIAYPTPEAFAAFLGDISTVTGVVTAALMLASPILFSKFSWGKVANLTPMILMWGGSLFFGSCLLFHLAPLLGISALAQPMMMSIILGGSCLYVLARGAKFSLFKPAEEMVYITLDSESKTQGKAAVDVVGAQVGKSGGSIMQQVLLMLSGGKLLSITPIMIVSYFYMLKLWKKAVHEIDARRFLSQQTPGSLDHSDEEIRHDVPMAVPSS